MSVRIRCLLDSQMPSGAHPQRHPILRASMTGILTKGTLAVCLCSPVWAMAIQGSGGTSPSVNTQLAQVTAKPGSSPDAELKAAFGFTTAVGKLYSA
ncbi:MAG: hypothetical protein JNJ88_04975 [Planctomycetes bacterium]|nr:hypothetical protein [Planctomycetota bacterium]